MAEAGLSAAWGVQKTLCTNNREQPTHKQINRKEEN